MLDAKKRGQQQAHLQNPQVDEHHLRVTNAYTSATLSGSAMMNLSTGNLALANKNGKSVSTSALGTSSATSVDRWAVVMDLLAQSRRQTPTGGRQEATETGLSGLDGSNLGSKRHSKQLDKFKLAARSAAAASKSQRGAHTKLQQVAPSQPPSNQIRSSSPGGPTSSVPLQVSNSNPIGTPAGGQAGGQQYHQLDTSFLSHTQLMTGEPDSPTASHLHQTKSLPVGGKQALPVGQEQLLMMSSVHHQHQPAYTHHAASLMQQAGQANQAQPASSAGSLAAHHFQHQHHQLLNIGTQQIHSTSGK